MDQPLQYILIYSGRFPFPERGVLRQPNLAVWCSLRDKSVSGSNHYLTDGHPYKSKMFDWKLYVPSQHPQYFMTRSIVCHACLQLSIWQLKRLHDVSGWILLVEVQL